MFSNLHGASDTLCHSLPFSLWPSSIISSLNLWQFVDRLPLLVPVHDVARKGHLPAQHQRRNRTAAASAPRGTSRPPHVLGRVPREVKHYDVLAVHAVNTCTVQYRGRGGQYTQSMPVRYSTEGWEEAVHAAQSMPAECGSISGDAE